VSKQDLFRNERYLQFCSICARQVKFEDKNDGATSVENLAIIDRARSMQHSARTEAYLYLEDPSHRRQNDNK